MVLDVGKSKINFTIDTGASVNIVDEETFNSLKEKQNLRKSSVRLLAYGSKTPISIIGEFKTRILYNHMYSSVVFQVVNGSPGNILGNETLCKMGIVRFVNSIERSVEEANENLVIKLKGLYPTVFSGKVGKLKNFQV